MGIFNFIQQEPQIIYNKEMQSFIYASTNIDEQAKLAEKATREVSQFDLFINDCEQNSGIEMIRELQSFLVRKPLQSPYNLAILKGAHLLSIEAQNALLKTLEEPPPNSKLILIVPHSFSLLPTIISRCSLEESSNQKTVSEIDWELMQKTLTSSSAQRLHLADNLDFDQWLRWWYSLLKGKINGETGHPLTQKLKVGQIQIYLKKLLTWSKMRESHVNSKLLNSVTLLSAPKLSS